MTVEETGIDYYELQGLLCESFGIMSLPSFEYMFNDYILIKIYGQDIRIKKQLYKGGME